MIELLIVIAIIAILAAIAIPQFLKYKQGAYIDSMRSDTKNAVTAVEAFNSQYGDLPTTTTCTWSSTASACNLTDGTNTSTGAITVSRNNIINYTTQTCGGSTAGAGSPGYTITVTNTTNAPGVTVSYDSCTGQYSGF